MIISKDFIWLHFPKCAGTHTSKILFTYFGDDPSIIFDKHGYENAHHTIAERSAASWIDLTNKDIICNFRRLPYWIISIIHLSKSIKTSPYPVMITLMAS